MKVFKFILILSFLISINLLSDTNFRLMSYNALNFDGTSRLSDFQTVLNNSEPDILICQEIKTESAADAMLSVLNSAIGGFARADFVADGDLNNMLFYKTSIASLTSQDEINTSPRDISEYVVNIDGNPIRFYSCHLKSSTGSTNEAERLAAVTIIRSHLNGLAEGTEFIIVGDMNFYTSSEDGYQKFIADEVINIGRAEDLCSEVGSWHDNSYYSDVHTQSTRETAFGYGAGGGLDDKFDFIFGNYGINNSLGIEFSAGTFTSYGNDGDHLNQSVNDGTNSAVPDSVADALYYASDHLPVYADFTSISGTPTYLIISEYIEGSSNNKAIEIYNGTGASVDLSAYSLEKDINGNEVWGNTYNYSGTLAHGEVFVLANPSAVQAILDEADDTDGGLIVFNGDDEVRLLKYGTEIDRIGIPSDVSFGENRTFVRKSTVTDPQSGPQDPRSNGEWDEYAIDTFSYLGSHSAINPTITVTSPNGSEEWERGNPYDITWTSSDFTDSVKIELYKETARDYNELVGSTDNDGLWQWNIPAEQTIAADYKIRISDASDGNPNDESDNFFSITGTETTTDLFISEYIEGSSNNKYLEIYNGTETSIDLANYTVKIYSNGSSSPTNTINLSGTLTAGNVYVLAHSSANAWSGTPDQTSGSLSFNGDDAVTLEGISGDVDVIGQIGVQQVWGSGDTTTQNHTLRRKSEITEGDADGYDVFDPTIEWDGFPQDTVDGLGSHGNGGNNPPAISNILTIPANPEADDTVDVTADVTDSDGTITSASLSWGTNGTTFPNNIDMVLNTRASYITENPIPAQIEGTTVYYFLEATDDDDDTTTSATNSYTIPTGSNEHTIYEIQGQTSSSPYNEQIVITSGIVTGTYTYGYFLQDGTGAWNGIFVYGSGHTAVIGDDATIEGEVYEYNGLTEIRTVTSYTVNSSGNELPAASVVSTLDAGTEDYEGVLITTTGDCDNENPDDPSDYGEWTINDGSGSIRIDDMGYPLEPILGTTYQVTGPVYYAYGNFKIEPRDENDVIANPQPDPPQNISISHDGTDVTISWDVEEELFYTIYSDSDPYGSFTNVEETGNTSGTFTEALNSMKFYRVTAE